LKDPVRPRIRPQTQNQNQDDYLHVLAEAGVGLEVPKPKFVGNRRVKKAYMHFLERIKAEANESGKSVIDVALGLLGRVKRANMIKLEVNTHADAFTLFESLNNRGMPLTPIDLIKNSLLGKADHLDNTTLDEAYEQWRSWLKVLGDDYSTQERFFRYFHIAMKDEFDLAIPGITIATRSNLIRIYETLIDRDLPHMLGSVSKGVDAFRVLIGETGSDKPGRLAEEFLRLRRAQGAPAQILLIYLVATRDEIDLPEEELLEITELLTSFFVRRNLTGTPATYSLVRLFSELVAKLRQTPTAAWKTVILDTLTAISASDETFESILVGPVYELNSDVVRFILTSLAESAMTGENVQDLWRRVETKGKETYFWTIEHILPQGENLPDGWIKMLGGKEHAEDARQGFAHNLGNLTITGFNSSLGNRTFAEKRDRLDSNGNSIGYQNGLSLNADLVNRESWGVADIRQRTEVLANSALSLFPLAYRSTYVRGPGGKVS
jgi:hypothetical protein